jgi:hypothetical protein
VVSHDSIRLFPLEISRNFEEFLGEEVKKKVKSEDGKINSQFKLIIDNLLTHKRRAISFGSGNEKKFRNSFRRRKKHQQEIERKFSLFDDVKALRSLESSQKTCKFRPLVIRLNCPKLLEFGGHQRHRSCGLSNLFKSPNESEKSNFFRAIRRHTRSSKPEHAVIHPGEPGPDAG